MIISHPRLEIDNYRKGLAVYVADDTVRAQESEAILTQLGFSNVRGYLSGMNEWDEAGGLIRYPKLITFPVSDKDFF
jgi:hypothetical protein